ncbi:MAG: flavodoxin domain-containing protein [Clostridia bacterium]|nr:flavodoxin domain-containing protein [Clostridia bacterium]
MKKVLIAYISKTNTTKEIGEHIKVALQTEEVSVEVLSFSEVKNIAAYDAVIIGAPINGMMWLPEATNFVISNKETLNKVPTAYYFVSYLFKDGRKMWRKAIDKSFNKASAAVKPVAVGKFTGRVGKKFPKFFAWVFGIRRDLPLDLVDFKEADEFVEEFKQHIK